jgi:hypothetical protein
MCSTLKEQTNTNVLAFFKAHRKIIEMLGQSLQTPLKRSDFHIAKSFRSGHNPGTPHAIKARKIAKGSRRNRQFPRTKKGTELEDLTERLSKERGESHTFDSLVMKLKMAVNPYYALDSLVEVALEVSWEL